jgi:hypothetical protein
MRARQASIAIARMTSARSVSSEGEVPHSPWFLYSLPSQMGHPLLSGESTGICIVAEHIPMYAHGYPSVLLDRIGRK